MIQCPDCGGFQVREERHVPLPTGRMTFLRYVGKAWTVILVVIALLGAFGVFKFIGWAAGLLPEEEGPGIGCVIAIGATMLFLLPYVISKGVSLVVSALTGFQKLASGPADELPRLYWRTCASCGFEWTWKPGEPQRKARARRAPAPTGVERAAARRQRRSLDKQSRRHLRLSKAHAYQPFLEELLAHWNGTHTPDPGFSLRIPDDAVAFFHDYQRALGEDPEMEVGHRVAGFIRNYYPWREEILVFMRAYQHLRRGNRAAAARALQGLVQSRPRFAEPWIWLSATTDSPGKRREYLGKAVQLEPAHPLALDAWAIIRGAVSPAGAQVDARESEVALVRCPRCGGPLCYEPGAKEVECRYCSYRIGLQEGGRRGFDLGEEAPLVTTLRLQRRIQGCDWQDVARTLRCQACGAEMGGIRHLAGQCAYCGSINVLVEDDPRTIQQPDGFLPFTVDERQAAAAVREASRAGLGRLRAWWSGKKCGKIKGLRGVYVPFWVFDGDVEVRWLYGRGSEASSSEREHRVRHHDLLFPGVDVPPPSLLDQVPPFRLRKLVPYEAHLLADWPAQLYTLDVEVVVEDAYDAMLLLSHRRAGAPVKVQVSWNASASSEARRSFQVSSVTYQLVLLPVWVTLLESDDGCSLALVNGQTGKAVIGFTLPGDS